MNNKLSYIEGAGSNGSRSYQCAFCGFFITTGDRQLTVKGQEIHKFTNPDGIEYTIRTFASCPGADMYGPAVEAHSWFPGHAWRLAICRACGAQLGWEYEAAAFAARPLHFWGLLTEMVEDGV